VQDAGCRIHPLTITLAIGLAAVKADGEGDGERDERAVCK